MDFQLLEAVPQLVAGQVEYFFTKYCHEQDSRMIKIYGKALRRKLNGIAKIKIRNLFPKDHFLPISLPKKIEQALG